jgi:hypothetical protein
MAHSLRYDHYKVLGIGRKADPEQVKQAYRERAKHYHPDVNPSPQAGSVFHAVHEAYRILSDPDARARYDEQLRFYRDASDTTKTSTQHKERRPYREPLAEDTTPPHWVELWAFRGLHFTGLVFGITLISTILIGLVFYSWPAFTLAFTAIGVGIIPDSLEGLKRRNC